MARISILRRERSIRLPEPGHPVEVVAVIYSTPAMPPRTVDAPLELYRLATPEEVEAHRVYEVVPVSEQAAETERQIIVADMKGYIQQPPESFESA